MKWSFICIIVLAVLFRFVYIDRIPAAIGGDELVYPLTAKSVALTGKDITGIWNIFESLVFRYPPDQQAAELPYFLNLPLSGYLPFSVLSVHLPFAILSVGIVVFLYLVTGILLGPAAATAAGFIAAVNPWFVVMGRTGYETTPATFFYLLGIYLLLKLKSKNILWSVIPFILAFYSYIGTKVLFVPVIILTSAVAFIRNRHKYITSYGILIILSFLFTAFFLISLRSSPRTSRITEILLPNAPEITARVNLDRKLSISSPLSVILNNKYTVYVATLTGKFFRTSSPSYLFLNGDLFFPLRGHGMFYPVDFILFLLGCLFLFTRRKLYFLMAMAFVLTGMAPQILFKLQNDYSLHLTLMYPVFVVIIGYGLSGLVASFPRRYKTILASCIFLIYLFGVVNFGYQYFFRQPLQEYGDLHMRILSRYITLNRNGNIPVSLYSDSNRDFLNKFLFYSNALNKKTVSVLRNSQFNSGFTLDGVKFYGCKNSAASGAAQELIITDASCSMSSTGSHLSISRFTDGGELYKIYNDRICGKFALQQYPAHMTFHKLAVESLTDREFCETFVTSQ